MSQLLFATMSERVTVRSTWTTDPQGVDHPRPGVQLEVKKALVTVIMNDIYYLAQNVCFLSPIFHPT
jgi:hypothetical protein